MQRKKHRIAGTKVPRPRPLGGLPRPFALAADVWQRARTVLGGRQDRALHRLRPTMMQLEPRHLMAGDVFQSTSVVQESAYADLVLADVVNRRLFYNNSAFDGQSAAVNFLDDAAIAADKSALPPGGQATFANYSSYSRGINGLDIDIAGLPAAPTLDDFTFAIGNSPDASEWTAAAAPTSIVVRPGFGQGGATRVSLTWADHAIENAWLQVTVRATPRTGIDGDDVFYFGSAVGETGNSSGNATVDVLDKNLVETLLGQAASITSTADFNRDGTVNFQDAAIVDAVRLAGGPALELIAPPAAQPTTIFKRPQIELFNWGDAAYTTFYSPAIVRATDGTLIVVAEGRVSTLDQSSISLVMRRSFDGGVTWSPIEEIFSVPRNSGQYVFNGVLVVDKTTGEIFNVFSANSVQMLVISSKDNGAHWSAPVDVTDTTFVTGPNSPAGHNYTAEPWTYSVPGPGHGVQLEHGQYAGRLIIPSYHRITLEGQGVYFAHVLYSDDHGKTWRLGGGLDQTLIGNRAGNEASIVEQLDGTLYMSMRMNLSGSSQRGYSRSVDGGLSWSPIRQDLVFSTPAVQGTTLRVNDNVLLFASPDGMDERRQMTIWASYDDAQTWVKKKVIFFGYSGYSDMVLVGPDTVLLTFNRGHEDGPSRSYEKLGAVRFNLRWLDSTDPYYFEWHFNEGQVGEAANILGTSILDYGPWDSRGRASSTDAPPVYVAGSSGDRALRLSEGGDQVILGPIRTRGLQFAAGDSFTAEVVLRTADADGVVLGANPGDPGWTLRLVGGKLELAVTDGTVTSFIRSANSINDGLWHRITAVRDATTHRLHLEIDGQAANPDAPDDTTGSLISASAVVLGAYSDGTAQLAADIDTVRITRAALTPDELLDPAAPAPQPWPVAPVDPAGPGVTDGLAFWLSPYDPSRFFADRGFSDPLPLEATYRQGVHSAIDSSDSAYRLEIPSSARYITYDWSPIVGPHWTHESVVAGSSASWTVTNSHGGSPHNFDFIQDTGVFTLSTFLRVGDNAGSYLALFDNADGITTRPGFTLALQNGGLRLGIGTAGAERYHDPGPVGSVISHVWYHIAVVGSGPGQPIRYYITPVDEETVAPFTPSSTIQGPNGDFATEPSQDLEIGALSNTASALAGDMVNQAIFDRALSSAEIQQLFEHGKQAPPNAAPSFVGGPNQVTQSTAVAQTVPLWANDIFAGSEAELSQKLTFVVANDNTDLFLEQPWIDSGGALHYRSAPLVEGAATVYVILYDDGGTGSGGVDASAPYQFTINIVPPDFMPVLGDMDGNGTTDNFDIGALELAVADPSAYLLQYPDLTDYILRGDINGDGQLDNFDLAPFEALLAESPIKGDLNGDSQFDNFDIGPFELALSDLAAYRLQYPSVVDPIWSGDMNEDSRLDNYDVASFAAAFAQDGPGDDSLAGGANLSRATMVALSALVNYRPLSGIGSDLAAHIALGYPTVEDN